MVIYVRTIITIFNVFENMKFGSGKKPLLGCQYHNIKLNDKINVMTVDLEYWHNIPCKDEVLYLLDLFARSNTKATFFTVGILAKANPDLIRQIVGAGHEIASHGWYHKPLTNIRPPEFREDLIRSKRFLEDLIGKPIIGFRAPIFSVRKKTTWVLEILVKEGIKYDSSIVPITGLRYGLQGFPRHAVKIELNHGLLIEIPLSTINALGLNWPVSGGGYFRLLPYILIEKAILRVNEEGLPFVVYCHPYEFYPHRLKYSKDESEMLFFWYRKRKEFKSNLLRKSMRFKLSRLLDKFSFTSFEEALRDEF